MSEDAIVRQAREFCIKVHAGQTRDGGGDYSNHPIAVAAILEERGHRDPVVQAVAFLHDTVEDTPTTREDLEAAFGAEIAALVMELTNRLPKDTPFADKQKSLLEHARRMSPRARLVKLADRLHNLRSMAAWCDGKQRRYANAAMDLLDALQPWPDVRLGSLVHETAQRVLDREPGHDTATS